MIKISIMIAKTMKEVGTYLSRRSAYALRVAKPYRVKSFVMDCW